MLRSLGWLSGLVAVSLITASGGSVAAAQTSPARTAAADIVVASGDADSEHSVDRAARNVTFTYRTTGAEGLSGALLYVPEGDAPEGGWPIIAWAHGTVGMADVDAPSSGPVYDIYRNLFDDWLGRGYVIVATDYAGLGTPGVHPYLDADVAAHNIVDSVRAARELVPDASDRWAVAGQSQGGHAALATASRAETLAPELDFRGTFASGAPTNLDRLVGLAGPEFPDLRLDGLTLYMAYIAAGLRESRPDIDVNAYLTPAGRDLIDAADTLPLSEFKPRASAIPVGDLFNRSLAGTPLPQAVTEYLGVSATGFDHPLMLVQGLSDSVVPPVLTLWYAADLTIAGEHFDLELPDSGHVDSLVKTMPEIGSYLDRILR